ncbi:hypothetical protein OIO90_001846 [Microbotryomycetes sp. JL221]|nr:hypothetical protein OIO90_001846 [Microbotryomycetes sp. JL221]
MPTTLLATDRGNRLINAWLSQQQSRSASTQFTTAQHVSTTTELRSLSRAFAQVDLRPLSTCSPRRTPVDPNAQTTKGATPAKTEAYSPQSPSATSTAPAGTQAILRRARFDYRKQLLRLRKELASLSRRLPPIVTRQSRKSSILALLVLTLAALVLLYNVFAPFRHLLIAADRCARVGWAVLWCIVDYKLLFRKEWDQTEEGRKQRHEDYESTHWKCAVRIREVLKKNGGIYIKLGQHLSAVQLIPVPWTEAMKPLQDQCFPTPLVELQQLFLTDVGAPLSAFFSTFDPHPIGVASLAQVHRATDRKTGKQVAVKVMHPDLEEFSTIDMKTTTLMLKVVKSVFPSFEFTWLGEEMEENLPLEMDFRHEAANAERCRADFASLTQTTLVVPKVLWAKKRAMVMEFIEGARIDDLDYLARHQIDRNQVAKQLQHIFSRMIYVTGFFHADPHGGNLLIRPRQPESRSPYNFEIVLLDHGLYFDMSADLRVNYAKLWLSLISPSSPSIEVERRKYAYLVGNIDSEMYPLFQAAITGRAALDDPFQNKPDGSKRGSVMELGESTAQEQRRMRHAIVETEGLMQSLFELLRRVPRRLLMVLKVNALDKSLHTTHSPTRIFIIVAHYCNLSIYTQDKQSLTHEYRQFGASFGLIRSFMSSWWRYKTWQVSLGVAEIWQDSQARISKWSLWLKGLRLHGFEGAWREEAGLTNR